MTNAETYELRLKIAKGLRTIWEARENADLLHRAACKAMTLHGSNGSVMTMWEVAMDIRHRGLAWDHANRRGVCKAQAALDSYDRDVADFGKRI